MSVYDKIVDKLYDDVHENKKLETGSGAANVMKGKRPLRMPKNYDFSVRHVNWKDYAKDYLLRTDAVWERTKLFDTFYSMYKSHFQYDSVNNKYKIADIRMMPLPTNEPEHLEDWTDFLGYTDIDGCVWQFRVGPMV
jgi:hypothetical protein